MAVGPGGGALCGCAAVAQSGAHGNGAVSPWEDGTEWGGWPNHGHVLGRTLPEAQALVGLRVLLLPASGGVGQGRCGGDGERKVSRKRGGEREKMRCYEKRCSRRSRGWDRELPARTHLGVPAALQWGSPTAQHIPVPQLRHRGEAELSRWPRLTLTQRAVALSRVAHRGHRVPFSPWSRGPRWVPPRSVPGRLLCCWRRHHAQTHTHRGRAGCSLPVPGTRGGDGAFLARGEEGLIRRRGSIRPFFHL